MADTGDMKSVWCLVANVTREPHPEGSSGEMRLGTRFFSPGAKVYCCPAMWGDGGERLVVYGRHRGADRLIRVVMTSKLLTNFRAKQVFDPTVVELFEDYVCINPDAAKVAAFEMAGAFAGRNDGQ